MSSYNRIRGEVGRYLGFTSDSSAWTPHERNLIGSIIDSGYREFLYPVIDGNIHNWSFLTKQYTFDTTSGVKEYALPNDFGTVRGKLFYADSSRCIHPIKMVPIETFSRTYAKESIGIPSIAAVIPASDGTRRLLLYRTPDNSYSLIMAYEFEPKLLSDTNAEPLGGVRHFETIQAACLYIAELRSLDNSLGGYAQYFQRRLLASIAEDKKNKIFDIISGGNGRGAYSRGELRLQSVNTNLNFGD